MTEPRSILITGGSRGIGAATARLAAEQGYNVAISYRGNRAQAEAVCADARAAGRDALAVQADLASDADIKSLWQQTVAHFGSVYGLVNNAGILEPQMRLDELDAARLARIFGVNVIGTLLCTREAVRHMSTRHGGCGGAIVNISSVAARLGSPGEYIDYAASKGAIDTATVGLAKEVAEEGIRVNGVRPGTIHTDIHAAGGEPDRVERVARLVPMRRGGQPGEIAAAILWLLSDGASYTSGTIIDVSGGL